MPLIQLTDLQFETIDSMTISLGFNHLNRNSDRRNDYLVGNLGQLGAWIYLLGNDRGFYAHLKKTQKENTDHGKDILNIPLDIKTSFHRTSRPIDQYRLMIAGSQFKDEWSYAQTVLAKDMRTVHLLGYALSTDKFTTYKTSLTAVSLRPIEKLKEVIEKYRKKYSN